MANVQADYQMEGLEPDFKSKSPFIEKKAFLGMPAAKRKRLTVRARRYSKYVTRKLTRPLLIMARKIQTAARQATKRWYDSNRFKKLPAELILEIMKKTSLEDLENLKLAYPRLKKIAMSNEKAIHVGMQQDRFPEYYRIFGSADRMTPGQEYHTKIEREYREWWETEADKWYGNNLYRQTKHGDVGRIYRYSDLARKIKHTMSALDDEQISFGAESTNWTWKALMLFWKMQWHDRPGLGHLCERSETEDSYIDIRQKLFAAEEPEVRARFIDILKPVASRLWERVEDCGITEAWSSTHADVIRNQQHIKINDLDSWVRELAAELIVEVICKIGIDRALYVYNEADHDGYYWDDYEVQYIDQRMENRLKELLERTAFLLRFQAPSTVFRFGRVIEVQPDDIINRTGSMLAYALTR